MANITAKTRLYYANSPPRKAIVYILSIAVELKKLVLKEATVERHSMQVWPNKGMDMGHAPTGWLGLWTFPVEGK